MDPWNNEKVPTELLAEIALKDEQISALKRHLQNIHQDNCENAFIQISIFDAVRQALFEVAPEHPALKSLPPNFGVWEDQQKRIEELEAYVEGVSRVI